MLTAPWSLLLQEEDRVVVIRFGHDYDETCMQMDEVGCCVCEPASAAAAAVHVRSTLCPALPAASTLLVLAAVTDCILELPMAESRCSLHRRV